MGEISEKVTLKNKDNTFDETLTNSAEFGIISQNDFFDKEISNRSNLNGYYVVENNNFVYNPRISNFAPVGPIKRNKLGRTGVMSPLYYVFKTRNIDNDFLEKYFDTTYWHIFMKLNGDSGARADRFAIKDSVFKEMPIPFPKIEEQIKIGNFFKQLDDTIALHQRNIEQVKELKHGYLQQLFPKNNELFPSVRFANFNGEWELRKLGELAKWTRGNGLSKSVLNKKGIGAEVIHYADLYKFGATINNVVNWSDSDQGTLIPLNSLLFPMSDVTSFGLARTSTINRLGVKASGDTLIATITSKENSQFISYQINASPKNILSLVTGTTVRHISSQNLSSLIIKLPSICEQTQIGNFFKQLDHIITIHQQKIDKLNHLKKAYLQNMFI